MRTICFDRCLFWGARQSWSDFLDIHTRLRGLYFVVSTNTNVQLPDFWIIMSAQAYSVAGEFIAVKIVSGTERDYNTQDS